MTADADRVIGEIDATLAGVGGVVEDYSVSVDAMRWAVDQPPPSTVRPGAWPEAILEQARERLGGEISTLTIDTTMQREWTLDEINQFVEEWSALFPPPPTVLRCHPAVLSALIGLTGDPASWPSRHTPGLVRIEIYTDADLPVGAWELRRGGDVVDQGVIAAVEEATT